MYVCIVKLFEMSESDVSTDASEEENSLKVLESNRLPLDPKYHELDLEIMPLQR